MPILQLRITNNPQLLQYDMHLPNGRVCKWKFQCHPILRFWRCRVRVIYNPVKSLPTKHSGPIERSFCCFLKHLIDSESRSLRFDSFRHPEQLAVHFGRCGNGRRHVIRHHLSAQMFRRSNRLGLNFRHYRPPFRCRVHIPIQWWRLKFICHLCRKFRYTNIDRLIVLQLLRLCNFRSGRIPAYLTLVLLQQN